MATATYPGAAGNVMKTEANTFIPEIWSDEIIAVYQKNLKMAPLVKKIAMTGKKGDKLTFQSPSVVMRMQKRLTLRLLSSQTPKAN